MLTVLIWAFCFLTGKLLQVNTGAKEQLFYEAPRGKPQMINKSKVSRYRGSQNFHEQRRKNSLLRDNMQYSSFILIELLFYQLIDFVIGINNFPG